LVFWSLPSPPPSTLHKGDLSSLNIDTEQLKKLEEEIAKLLTSQTSSQALPETKRFFSPVLQRGLHWLDEKDRNNILDAFYLSRKTGRDIAQRRDYVDPPSTNQARYTMELSILPPALRMEAPTSSTQADAQAEPITCSDSAAAAASKVELEELLAQKKILQEELTKECAASKNRNHKACDGVGDSDEAAPGSAAGESAAESESEPSPEGIIVQRFTNPQGTNFDVATFERVSNLRATGGWFATDRYTQMSLLFHQSVAIMLFHASVIIFIISICFRCNHSLTRYTRSPVHYTNSFFEGYVWKNLQAGADHPEDQEHYGWYFEHALAQKCATLPVSSNGAPTPADVRPGTQAEAEAPEPKAKSIPEVMRALATECRSLPRGWWTYEVCFRQKVRQFHKERRAEEADQSQDWSLGKFDEAATKANFNPKDGKDYRDEAGNVVKFEFTNGHRRAKRAYIAEAYTGGQWCDETMKGRSTMAKYYCCDSEIKKSTQLFVKDVVEVSTCVYEIMICVPQLCDFPEFATKPAPSASSSQMKKGPTAPGSSSSDKILPNTKTPKGPKTPASPSPTLTAEDTAFLAQFKYRHECENAIVQKGILPRFYGLLWDKLLAQGF
jgi:hypothetical protein